MYVKFRLVKLRERKATKYYSDFNILYNGRNIKNDRHTNTLFRKFHYAHHILYYNKKIPSFGF